MGVDRLLLNEANSLLGTKFAIIGNLGTKDPSAGMLPRECIHYPGDQNEYRILILTEHALDTSSVFNMYFSFVPMR